MRPDPAGLRWMNNKEITMRLPRAGLRVPATVMPLALVISMLAACASSGDRVRCPDGSTVLGSECHLAPDGSYYGDGAEIPEDVADDVADSIDEEADEQSGIYTEEVVEIEIGGN